MQAGKEGKQLNRDVVTANAELRPAHCTEAWIVTQNYLDWTPTIAAEEG